MRLATVRYKAVTYAARVEDEHYELLPEPDLGALLGSIGGLGEVSALAPTRRVAHEEADLLTLVPRPSKVMCIGQNYMRHIEEVGAEPPRHPTVFAKYARALIADADPIVIPSISDRLDWEVELVMVIGRLVRNASSLQAEQAIAGFTVGNDVSARDLQKRTSQWLQGKTCEATTPVGPWMTTSDVVGSAPDLAITCSVDGDVRQNSRTSDMLFKPVELVEYLSRIITLEPGDLIFTGTPGGVGQGMVPPVFLRPGQVVKSSIESIGSLVNPCRAA